MAVNELHRYPLTYDFQNDPKVNYVYYDHYKEVLRENFVKVFIKMRHEGYGAILRKKVFGSRSFKITTAIFDDAAEARDEMTFEIGSLVESGSSSIKTASLKFSSYRAHVIVLGEKALRAEYQIYLLGNIKLPLNKFSLSA